MRLSPILRYVAKRQDMRVELARLPAVCYSIESYFLGGRIYYV